MVYINSMEAETIDKAEKENILPEATIKRTINGLIPENWKQFTFWAKRLGFSHASFFSELMRFYFEKNKEELEKKMNTIVIYTNPAPKVHAVSAYCQQDIDVVTNYANADGATAVGLADRIEYLDKTYLKTNKHPKEDREAIKDLIASLKDVKL